MWVDLKIRPQKPEGKHKVSMVIEMWLKLVEQSAH